MLYVTQCFQCLTKTVDSLSDDSYGGELVPSYQADKATHSIVENIKVST